MSPLNEFIMLVGMILIAWIFAESKDTDDRR